jgi:hypothetical protein
LNAYDDQPSAAIAELDLLDPDGNSISHPNWTIAYVDSEELASEDGSASNAINGQTSDYWHTAGAANNPDILTNWSSTWVKTFVSVDSVIRRSPGQRRPDASKITAFTSGRIWSSKLIKWNIEARK